MVSVKCFKNLFFKLFKYSRKPHIRTCSDVFSLIDKIVTLQSFAIQSNQMQSEGVNQTANFASRAEEIPRAVYILMRAASISCAHFLLLVVKRPNSPIERDTLAVFKRFRKSIHARSYCSQKNLPRALCKVSSLGVK